MIFWVSKIENIKITKSADGRRMVGEFYKEDGTPRGSLIMDTWVARQFSRDLSETLKGV